MSSSFQQVFIDEAVEIFGSLENDLIALETSSGDTELINKIFREMHTLKGSGSMFGFTNLARFAHGLETLFDAVRNNHLVVNQEIISISLESLDFMKALIDKQDTADKARFDSLSGTIHSLLPAQSETAATKVPLPQAQESAPNEIPKVYRISFKPDKDIFIKGINPVVLLKNLASLGRTFVFTHEESVPLIGEMDPELCHLSWTIILITGKPLDEIRDIFIFVEVSAKISIDELYHTTRELEEQSIPLLGEILHEKGDISAEDITRILDKKPLFGDQAISLGITTPEKVASALFEQQTIRTLQKNVQTQVSSSTIRVQHEKLDTLTNSVSELVTLQARLTQFAESQRGAELGAIAEYLEKLTSSLRDTVMMIRMIPVEEGFSSMHRLVRDLAKALGKEVQLTIVGGDTELDKTVIDNLKDPMMHLVRNSIDHGIESPEKRIAAGKPAKGTITISAEHRGAHALISVSDDGRGLDGVKIRSTAINKGLISPDDARTDRDIYQLIFLPGFSTAEKTTDVSGRGVGMDVVKRNIEMIRGEVSLDSVPGKGSTVNMKLPITMAIIDGLLFSVADELFVVNISVVSECVELTSAIQLAAGERDILKLRDTIVPYVYLRDILNIPGTPPEHQQIIIINTHEQTLGLVVDSVAGKHQTVVKSTGRVFSNVREVTGATILGNGRIALILDTNIIAQKVHELQSTYQRAVA